MQVSGKELSLCHKLTFSNLNTVHPDGVNLFKHYFLSSYIFFSVNYIVSYLTDFLKFNHYRVWSILKVY